MRRARITYEGAFHHAMNRGINGEEIFISPENKNQFLDYLAEKSKKLKIRVFAYCILNNHYHLVLENSLGRMSDFFKHLNGQYGMYYRKSTGGKGYVFQGRYKSTLIQDESYLRMSIVYTLLNPVRAGIVKQTGDYAWSSFNYYCRSEEDSEIVDSNFVEELFGSRNEFLNFIHTQTRNELPVLKTRYGDILGSPSFVDEAVKRYNRRKKQVGIHGKRIDDRYIEPVEKVIWEFERLRGIKIDDIDTTGFKGKRLRGELLVHLKDRAVLTYSEIIKFDIFDDLSFGSLGSIYRNSKIRIKENQ
jgi:REP element-mobilizing transposase RayT